MEDNQSQKFNPEKSKRTSIEETLRLETRNIRAADIEANWNWIRKFKSDYLPELARHGQFGSAMSPTATPLGDFYAAARSNVIARHFRDPNVFNVPKSSAGKQTYKTFETKLWNEIQTGSALTQEGAVQWITIYRSEYFPRLVGEGVHDRSLPLQATPLGIYYDFLEESLLQRELAVA
ncbi:MAG: hypothetical protein ABL864_04090 [Terricaulis sp.]